MRILLLTQVVPFPPDSGPRIKTHHVLRYLAERHEVHLVSFVRDAVEESHARHLESVCASVRAVPLRRSRVADVRFLARSLLTGRPFLVERDDLPDMRAAIREVVARHSFDAVHADQLTMGQFARDCAIPLRVLDEHNAVWSIVQRAAKAEPAARRPLAELEWRKLRSYEGTVCRSFDWVTVVSHDDRAALEDAAGGPFNSKVIPITMDTKALPFRPPSAGAEDILSVATMYYPPNADAVHWFATTAFPLVRSALPSSRFVVVGSRPPLHVRRLATDISGVVVTGYQADLDPVFASAAVLVVPVSAGSGMRVKILEAFARGIPVVSTTVGVEGIEARAGEHLLVADTPDDFARAVLRLLHDRALGIRLAGAARALIEQRYEWRTALRALDSVYAPEARPLVAR